MQRPIWLLALFCFFSFGSAQAQQWRVVAQINEVYDDLNTSNYRYYPTDSIVYHYDDMSKGSNVMNDTILFSNAAYYTTDSVGAFNYNFCIIYLEPTTATTTSYLATILKTTHSTDGCLLMLIPLCTAMVSWY